MKDSETGQDTEESAERFLAVVSAVCAINSELTPLSAAILIAPHIGIASDSRTFSRLVDVEHALVLRELTALAENATLLRIIDRNERTQRAHYQLTAGGAALVTLALSNLERETDDGERL